MAKVIDYLRDANNELRIENGDFVKGDATEKHQHTLLMAEPGDFKLSPRIGCGIVSLLLSDSTADDARAVIQKGFEADGMHINELKITGSSIEVNASYNDPD